MSTPLKKGPVAVNSLRNGEEVLQYHRGRLKLIIKEFGKLFELEFSSKELKETKTFAKYSDVKAPLKNAVKVFKDGVRVAEGKSFYGSVPASGDSNTLSGEFEKTGDGSNVIPK